MIEIALVVIVLILLFGSGNLLQGVGALLVVLLAIPGAAIVYAIATM